VGSLGQAYGAPCTAARTRRLGHNPPIGTDEIQDEIALLEQELKRVQASVAENDAALATLDEQRQERQGRLALARRAHEDVNRRLEERRVELARAEADAAVEAYERVLRERDVAAEALASAADAVTARLREYEAAQERAAGAWDAVLAQRELLPELGRETLAEPDQDAPRVNEAREMLLGLVRNWLDHDLERDLVEAAARSPAGYAIEKLPEHLRALARERRIAIGRAARAPHRS
jgi:hypothetical protein